MNDVFNLFCCEDVKNWSSHAEMAAAGTELQCGKK